MFGRRMCCAIAIVAVTVCTGTAYGAVIGVQNAGFEQPATSD